MERAEWMTDEFVEAVRNAVYRLDEAVDLLNDAIYEAESVEDNDEAFDVSRELQWDYADVIEDLSTKLYHMVGEEE